MYVFIDYAKAFDYVDHNKLWNFLKEMGIPDHLTCLLRNLCAGLELSCFFDDPADVGNLIVGSFAFSKTSLNNWEFTFLVLLKPGLENFEHYFTSV